MFKKSIILTLILGLVCTFPAASFAGVEGGSGNADQFYTYSDTQGDSQTGLNDGTDQQGQFQENDQNQQDQQNNQNDQGGQNDQGDQGSQGNEGGEGDDPSNPPSTDDPVIDEPEPIKVVYESKTMWIGTKLYVKAQSGVVITKWTSSNPAVASVSNAGYVKALKVGKAVLKGYNAEGTLCKQSTITVAKVIYTSQIMRAKHNYQMKAQSGVKITKWTTSNSAAVSITNTGYARAKRLGKATLRGYNASGKMCKQVTVTVKLGRDYALFVAHRGHSLIAPENTLPAYREAVRAGFRGIELDVWESRSTSKASPPLIIVMHDSNLKSKTGKNKKTQNLNWVNRKSYRIKKNVHGLKKYGSQPIPNINEAFNCIYTEANKQGYKDFVVEIDVKNKLSDRAVKYIIKVVGKHRVHILSSHQDTLKKFKKYRKYRTTEVWYCTGNNNKSKRMKNVRSACNARFDGISLPARNMNGATIKLVRSKGLQIGVYNVESSANVQKWRNAGCTRFNMFHKVFLK